MLRYAFFFYERKTAYELRISDWSSDVGSSDLPAGTVRLRQCRRQPGPPRRPARQSRQGRERRLRPEPPHHGRPSRNHGPAALTTTAHQRRRPTPCPAPKTPPASSHSDRKSVVSETR